VNVAPNPLSAEVALRLPPLLLGPGDTGKRGGKIEILVQRALHHRNEHRIVETYPPTVERRCRILRLCRAGPARL